MNISEREKEILTCLCDGLPSKQIAHRLSISHTWTRQILWKLCKRFNCPNSVSLALFAKEKILVTKVSSGKKAR
jgi:DNA-binding NarL/FixJ family response regulator